MKKLVLSNGIKLIYEKVPGDITSFTIGFQAGANEENIEKLGIAHCTEHMVFKGTKTKTEKEINDLCNEYLGFHNAMTNYPYAVYYGSCLKEDFTKGFQLYFDIVFNPIFKEDGFKEEISVILEELKEWSDDVVQHCEDMVFFNSFENRRIKELIIGTETTITGLTIEDVKSFHKKYYTPYNCVISVVTCLELKEIVAIIEDEINKGPLENLIEGLKVESKVNINNLLPLYENPKNQTFEEENLTINGCKVQYIFPIHKLSEEEVSMLHLFNEYFASGTSSILYDEIRTKRGLVYDIQGRVKGEKGIKLYTITLSTSKENLGLVQEIIEENIKRVKVTKGIFNEEFFKKYSKNLNRKRMLGLEKSIVMSMHLAVYEIIHSGAELLLNEFKELNEGSEKEMVHILNEVFEHKAIGIIKN